MKTFGRIEAELGVKLPEQYSKFLRRFGFAGWYGREILGVRPSDVTGRPSVVISDVVSKTKRERRTNNPLGTSHLPSEHVVISTDGSGGNYVLFTTGSRHEGEVHYYNLEDQAEPIEVWKTFQDYLEWQIQEAGGA